mmetsp:Transcript_43428/g.120154  ORF Transcript_43428/g.120154 Transcript_43428/m.120154 type:complete len:574 (+) Transcript_43428:31-1752(+)
MSDQQNYYDLLGVLKTASEKEITEAYNTFSDNYDPANEESADRFKEVTLAYQTLSDESKREQYDTELMMQTNSAANNGGGLFGKAFGAVGAIASRVRSFSAVAAVPPSIMNSTVMETAATIMSGGSFEGGGAPMDSRVNDLVWGSVIEGKAERHNAAFYRLTVDNAHAENGFVVMCRSAKRDKFKVAMFDESGKEVTYHEDSQRVKDKPFTQATLFFTSFDTYQLKEPPVDVQETKNLPPVFFKLQNFAPTNKRTLSPGQYLLCVYGDNTIGFGRSVFGIVALPAKNDAPAVTEIEETDESLLECKKTLQALKSQYEEAKAAYDSVQAKVKEQQESMDVLLLAREKSYQSFLDSSVEVYLPPESAPKAPVPPENHNTATADTAAAAENAHETDAGKGGAAAYITAAATAASSYTAAASNAAKSASEATGWVARRLSAFVKKSGDDESGENAAAETCDVSVPQADPEVEAAASQNQDFFDEPSSPAKPTTTNDTLAADNSIETSHDNTATEKDAVEETAEEAPEAEVEDKEAAVEESEPVSEGGTNSGGSGGGKKAKKKAKKAAAAAAKAEENN